MPTIYPGSILKRILLGAGLGLALISFFLINVKNPDPAWSNLWMLRPVLIVSIAGAGAGICSHFLDRLRFQKGWNKTWIVALGIIGHLIALWMGFVAGLDGTLWH